MLKNLFEIFGTQNFPYRKIFLTYTFLFRHEGQSPCAQEGEAFFGKKKRAEEMKVGFIQMNPQFLDKEGNVNRALGLLDKSEAELMVLPELFSTGYNFSNVNELRFMAEDIPMGYTTQKLIEISLQKSMCIIAGIAEKYHGALFNSAVIVNGHRVGVYRKIHLFMNEKQLFTQGNKFTVFQVNGINIGIMTCFDWYFPESVRTLMLRGADIIAHPSNLILPYCPDAMKLRSLENGVFTITANRIGDEKGLHFIGMSQITDNKGNILYRASSDSEEVKILDIDPVAARDKNFTPINNILADRKEDCYVSSIDIKK